MVKQVRLGIRGDFSPGYHGGYCPDISGVFGALSAEFGYAPQLEESNAHFWAFHEGEGGDHPVRAHSGEEVAWVSLSF